MKFSLKYIFILFIFIFSQNIVLPKDNYTKIVYLKYDEDRFTRLTCNEFGNEFSKGNKTKILSKNDQIIMNNYLIKIDLSSFQKPYTLDYGNYSKNDFECSKDLFNTSGKIIVKKNKIVTEYCFNTSAIQYNNYCYNLDEEIIVILKKYIEWW